MFLLKEIKQFNANKKQQKKKKKKKTKGLKIIFELKTKFRIFIFLVTLLFLEC
jgi:hypothetical protein